MAFQTRLARSGSTVEMWLTARETVAMETPARWATSRMLTDPGRRRLGELFLAALTGEIIVRLLAVSQTEMRPLIYRNAL